MFTDKKLVAEKLNTFFIETVDHLHIERYTNDSNENYDTNDIQDILKAYATHPSILKIKENVCIENKFLFNQITSELFEKQLLNLDSKKRVIVMICR